MNVALVTGASSGIGTAIARVFADAGWRVMAAGRDEKRLQDALPATDHVSTWAGSLASAADCTRLIDATIDRFGRIDCLVNNAGIIVRADVSGTTDEDWRRTMTINLDVPFFLSRAALTHLLSARGSIINIASDWGINGGEQAAAYCASKGGLVLLTKAMARDHAKAGLRINAICPGDVDTPMLTAEAEASSTAIDDFLESAAAAVPRGRIAQPGEIASLALFLAGEGAAHINGTAILVGGGANA